MSRHPLSVTAGVLLLLACCVFPRAAATQTPPSRVWVIQSITVGVPGAPNGGSWDTAVGSVLGLLTRGTQGLKDIQPDVRICVQSAHVPGTCMPVCPDADYINESMAYVCTQATGPSGLFLEAKLHVLVQEVDPGSVRVIDEFLVEDPTTCEPCTHPTAGGTLWIRFQFAQVASYTGPFRGTSGTTAPSGLPIATPSSGGGSTAAGAPAPTPTPKPSPAIQPAAPPPANVTVSVAPVQLPSAPLVDVKLVDENIPTVTVPGRPFILGTGDPCCADQSDVTQGQAGNCFLMSSLAAIVAVSPGTIKNAIKDNRDGTYDVTLHLVDQNGILAPAVVRRLDSTFPTPSWSTRWLGGQPTSPSTWNMFQPFIALYAQPGDRDGNDYEFWTMLIEKAYAQVHGGYLAEDFTKGDPPSYAMQTITGKTSERWLVGRYPTGLGLNALQAAWTISTETQLGKTLSDNLRNQHAIVAGTLPLCPSVSLWDYATSWLSSSSSPPLAWVDPNGDPTSEFRCTTKSDPLFQEAGGRLIRDHAYFVRGFIAGGTQIVLGNPWGGDVTVTHAEFLTGFRQLHINAPQIVKDCTCGL